MRTRIGMLALAGAVTACSGSTSEPVQLLAHGIVSGNNQVAIAGAAQLSAGVTEQMVKNSSGQISMRRVDDPAWQRALDVIVPRANAQTVVNGSPVVGAVVCAVSPDPAHVLVPFTPCTNTDAAGKATFFFAPGTGAGVARAEIRGSVANAPTVFDTARATVMPGGVADVQLLNSPNGPGMPWDIAPGGALDLHKIISVVRDRYNNFIAPAAAQYVSISGLADTTTTFTPRFAIRDIVANTQTAITSGWLVAPQNTTGSPRTYQIFLYGEGDVALLTNLSMTAH